MVAELEEERRKHEHDTAQGDDVTYALEKDRTRLKQVGRMALTLGMNLSFSAGTTSLFQRRHITFSDTHCPSACIL